MDVSMMAQMEKMIQAVFTKGKGKAKGKGKGKEQRDQQVYSPYQGYAPQWKDSHEGKGRYKGDSKGKGKGKGETMTWAKGKGKGKGVCWTCGEPGHLQRDCWYGGAYEVGDAEWEPKEEHKEEEGEAEESRMDGECGGAEEDGEEYLLFCVRDEQEEE